MENWKWKFGCAIVALLALYVVSSARAEEGTSPPHPNDLMGSAQTYTTVADDTLMKVAIDHNLGLIELLAANPGVDPWFPGNDRVLKLPTMHLLPPGPRKGIVVNLPEQRLYHFNSNGATQSYPVAVGRGICDLKPGAVKVTRRRRQPSWRPSAKLRAVRPDLPKIVPPGPRNPLGKYALDLDLKGALIHGSTRPFTDKSDQTQGCIRLYPEHMATLYQSSRKGTLVTVLDQPVKLGWADGELYMEVHPSLEHTKSINTLRQRRAQRIPGLDARLAEVAGADTDRIDRALVRKIVREGSGLPVKITKPRPKPKVKKIRSLFGN